MPINIISKTVLPDGDLEVEIECHRCTQTFVYTAPKGTTISRKYCEPCREVRKELAAAEHNNRKLHPEQYPPGPKVPAERKRINSPICGGKRISAQAKVDNPESDGGVCCLPPGWGTSHPGEGFCKWHGGALPQHIAKLQKDKILATLAAEPTFGAPIQVDPHEAILQEVHRTAGHVEWLRQQIAHLGFAPDDPGADTIEEYTGRRPIGRDRTLSQATLAGITPSVWIATYQQERSHLIRTCKMAVDMGCAEAQVRIQRDQGRLLASVIQRILNDPRLDFTPQQRSIAPDVAREAILTLPTEAATEISSSPAEDPNASQT